MNYLVSILIFIFKLHFSNRMSFLCAFASQISISFFMQKNAFPICFFHVFFFQSENIFPFETVASLVSYHCNANIIALLKSNMVSISSQTVEKQHHQIHTNKIMLNKNSFLPCHQRKMCNFIQVLLGSCRIYVWFTMFFPQNKKRLRKTKTSQENLNFLHFSSAAPWECIFHS